MKTSILSLLVIFALILTAHAQCGRTCRFRFCRPDGSLRPKGARILLRGPGYTRSAAICRTFRNERSVGTVRKTGPALVEDNSTTTAINRFRPEGLSPFLPRNYFRLNRFEFESDRQGISRRAPRGNQNDFLDDLCIRLPILNYDIVNDDGSVFRTIATSNPRDCISFRTTARPIVVDVAWDSSDDFDLSVEGPPGSEGGRTNDNLVSVCGEIPSGKEAVSFTSMIPGTYTVKLFHFNNCFGNRTRWVVNVVINGQRTLRRKGRSSADGREVLEFTFEVEDEDSSR